jgi:polyisoprenoid-binding protein YceI
MTSFRRTLVVIALLAPPAGAARAAEETFTITPANTVPSFEVGHLGFASQRGRFNETHGKVVMDPQKRVGSVDITIDAKSVDTGIRQLDEVLRELDFLNIRRHPTLSFRSSQLRFNSDKLVGVDGVMTMLGISRPISLTVTHYQCGIDPARSQYICDVDAEATFRRSDYGMTRFIPVVSDEVKLRIRVTAARDQ